MVESNATRVIRETRQTKYYLAISIAELQYVSKSKLLNATEKLIWINIASKTALDPNLSSSLTQNQIAEMVGKGPDAVYRAIRTLKFHGFLKSSYETGANASIYYLSLPAEGLEVLKGAPNRTVTSADPEKNQATPCKYAGTPPANSHPLLIINNINNKNTNHNLDVPKAAHDSEPESKPIEPRHITVSNADALIREFKKIIQEKYQHLPMPKRPRAAMSHFTDAEKQLINERQIALAAIHDGQKIKASQEQAAQFNQKLAEAKPVPPTRPQPTNCKLLEFEFDNEYFLIEEKVKNQILQEIPRLYQQKQIQGDSAQKPIQTLLKEIFYYVSKVASKALDACQLKRFYIARKLCLNGSWERPKGLERQASIQREQKWQQDKLNEYKGAKSFMNDFVKNVA